MSAQFDQPAKGQVQIKSGAYLLEQCEVKTAGRLETPAEHGLGLSSLGILAIFGLALQGRYVILKSKIPKLLLDLSVERILEIKNENLLVDLLQLLLAYPGVIVVQ